MKTTILLIFLLSTPAFAWQGTISKVNTPTSFLIENYKGEMVHIHVYGMKPCSPDDKTISETYNYLNNFVGHKVDVTNISRDKYGRMISMISLENNINLNTKIITDGYAATNKKSCLSKITKEWIEVENEARLEKRGLWKNIKNNNT